LDAEPPTEPMAAMAVATLGKVEHDQRVTAKRSRTGGNRTGRPNLTELDFGWRAGQGGVEESSR